VTTSQPIEKLQITSHHGGVSGLYHPIRLTPILSNWPLMKASSHPHRKENRWLASGESRGVGGLFRFRWSTPVLLPENAPKKMSVPVLDTMISHMRTSRNRTLQSEKLSMNGVFDHLEPRVSIPVSPTTTRRSSVDSEGSACIADPRILSWWTETDLRTDSLHQSDAPLGLTWCS